MSRAVHQARAILAFARGVIDPPAYCAWSSRWASGRVAYHRELALLELQLGARR
jgi:hypothetical protein